MAKPCHALFNHSGIHDDKYDTAIFLNKVFTWWKIINVKGKIADVRHTDPLQAVISYPHDSRLDIILEFGNMALKMAGAQGETTVKAVALNHTYNGLVELCRHLLVSTHQYVILGKFTTDYLEKEFGKLRQGSGDTYCHLRGTGD